MITYETNKNLIIDDGLGGSTLVLFGFYLLYGDAMDVPAGMDMVLWF
jgi:hypothetical protein